MNRLLRGGEPFFFPGGRTGCLLIHGFTASPQEMRRLGEHLAGEGHTVLGVRLPGHATRLSDMLRVRWEDWYAAVLDGAHLLRGQCTEIVPVGLSLGGALALRFSSEHPVAGVVALSTPYRQPTDPRLRLLRHFTWIVRSWPKGPPDWRDPQAQSERVAYPSYPLRTIAEVEAALAAMRAELAQIRAPVLLMHSVDDEFVPPDDMRLIADGLRAGSVETVRIANSNHILTCDAARHQVFARVAAFVRRHTRGSR
jgi:carboxylesterase